MLLFSIKVIEQSVVLDWEAFYLIDNSGKAVGFGPITGGQINRGNKTWEFGTVSVTKFQAKLVNGNMVEYEYEI